MKYLSFDLEATGLNENDKIIEFACVPFCTQKREIEKNLTFHSFIKCPSFENLKPSLDPWVIKHNEHLIRKAHDTGLEINEFKRQLQNYLTQDDLTNYFENQKITLFGKSMAAIDLPFLNRDLGWDWMRTYFEHRQLDLSSVSYALIDLGYLPEKCQSGSALMKDLGFGEVSHTALEDSINTANMYLKIIEKFAR